ncbi:ribonuclease J [Thermoflexus sp.]|uniref:ribonuclease J n=1 Tax=Thermoflexus sp. TaxID=1969742 RepID=UPI0035E4633D
MAQVLRIVPLGGLGEIGKNMMAIEYGRNILIIDAGIMFPENDMLGVDFIIPDWQYLQDKKAWVRAIVVTHGHEDHIGALPFLIREIPAPIYATPLTRGLIEVKLKQAKASEGVTLHTVQAGDRLSIGPFTVELFRVCHSIPDGVGLGITTPAGLIVHTGDFKFDQTPVDGKPTDFAALAEFSKRGVLALLSDSTNADRPGWTPSERVIDSAFDAAFRQAKGRIIIATFASLISRFQQVIQAALRYGRKVAFAGTSMVENVKIAQKLGYLEIPPGVLIRPDEIGRYPPHQVVIVTTGAQGEPSSVLARMAAGQHSQLRIVPGDTVIISAHPIPGNEEMVHRTINRLFQRGADVLYDPIAPVHVSGHASQEELKLMINLVRPRYFIPIHGEIRHLKAHARLAMELGIPAENIFAVENGWVIEFKDGQGQVAERVPGGYVFVDGALVGDIGPEVLREREVLSREGFVVIVVRRDPRTGRVIGRPELITRGFTFAREAEELLAGAEELIIETVRSANGESRSRQALAHRIQTALADYLYRHTRRRPMIIPVITE